MLRAPSRNACGVLLTACLLAAACGSAFGDCHTSAGMSRDGTSALYKAATPQLVAAEKILMKALAPGFCGTYNFKKGYTKYGVRKGSWCEKIIKGGGAYMNQLSEGSGGIEVKRMFMLKSYLGIAQYDQVVAQKADMEGLCSHLLEELDHHHPVCNTAYAIPDSTIHGTINCRGNYNKGYGERPADEPKVPGSRKRGYRANDLTAVLDICTTPCIHDRAQTCCSVPKLIAFRFPCCRELHCCPDQMRRRLASAQNVTAPRKAQVSVAVSVSVEDNAASSSVYDALLRCLQNPAKLDAMCLTGSAGH